MKSIIFKQLNKCKIAKVQNLSGEETEIFIPKCTQINADALELDHTYILEVDNYMLNLNESNSTIVSNWNSGQVIKSKFLRVSLCKVLNNMFQFDGVGYNMDEQKPLTDFYSSLWIPKEHFSILKEIVQ